MLYRTHYISSTGFPLGPNHRSSLGNPPNRLTKTGASTDEWNCVVVFWDVEERVCWSKDLRFIDHIYSK